MTCPVCYTPVSADETEFCPVCGWYLESSKEREKGDRLHLEWAQHIWHSLQSYSENAIAERLDRLEALEREAMADRRELFSWVEWLRDRDFATADNTPVYSEVGIDFNPLFEYLSAQNWRDADAETWRIVLEAAGREKEGWLRLEDIEAFAATDLLTLDRAWYEYSEGGFGLGVQQWIWEEVEANYDRFCDRVGWRVGDRWTSYEELSFETSPLVGHFPVLPWRKRSCYGVGERSAAENLAAWFQRLDAIADITN